MKILALVSGTNDPSNSETLTERFLEGVRDVPGMETEKVLLKNIPLVHFNLRHYDEPEQNRDMEDLKKMILEADGILISAPVWNFSVPAHLKNLIDRMGSFALDEKHSLGTLQKKPFYLLYTFGAPGPAWALYRRTLSHVWVSLEYFGASVIGTFYEGRCTKGRGIFGLVVDSRPDCLLKARESGKMFAESVKRFAETGKLPFKYRVRAKFVRIAQTIKHKLGL